MTTLLLVLAAGMAVPGMAVPGIGPEKVSGEVEQGLDLRGEWEGTHQRPLGKPVAVRLRHTSHLGWVLRATHRIGGKNVVELRPLGTVTDEGKGCLKIGNGNTLLGIYKWDGESLLICYRSVEVSRPTSFHARDDQTLLILRRVKPGK
jgi:hypothetical protein